MIIVRPKESGDSFCVEVTGHAGYVKPGEKDMVCAAATILIRALAEIVDETGHGQQVLAHGASMVRGSGHEEYLAYKTIMTGFRLLEQNYPDNLQIRG